MAGRRRLRAGAPRLLGKHDGLRGKWYRECWAALLAEFGALEGLRRLEGGRVAVAWVQLRQATAALEEARRGASEGRGRRPGARDLERLARRQGLADASYSQALDKLTVLCQPHRKTPTPADLVERLRARSGVRP
jgi:hypothetical protein